MPWRKRGCTRLTDSRTLAHAVVPRRPGSYVQVFGSQNKVCLTTSAGRQRSRCLLLYSKEVIATAAETFLPIAKLSVLHEEVATLPGHPSPCDKVRNGHSEAFARLLA